MQKRNYEIIDAHCHVYPEKIAAKAAISVGNFYGEEPACTGTVEELLMLGREAGIDRFVVQSVATAPKQVESINNFIATEVEKSNGTLIGFGTLHPESVDIAADFAHLRALGLKGIKLHPDIQGFCLDDPRCMKMYELCEQEGIPVLLHTGDSRYDYSNPNRFLPVMRQFRGVTFIGAHLGGWSLWERACDELGAEPNLMVDCSSSLSYIPAETAKTVIRRYGAERVLFGTDFPLHSPVDEMRRFETLGLDAAEEKAILSDNIKKLLGI